MNSFIIKTWNKIFYGNNFIGWLYLELKARRGIKTYTDEELWKYWEVYSQVPNIQFKHSFSAHLFNAICREISRRATKADRRTRHEKRKL